MLKVVDGEWAPAASGDAGALYITPTLGDVAWSLNASYNEIAAAVAAGKSVFVAMDNSSESTTQTIYFALASLSVYAGAYDVGTSYGASFGNFAFSASGPDDDMVEA